MGFNKFNALVISVFAFSGSALAAEYSCSVKDNGYSHSTQAAAGNLPKQIEIVKSWIPSNFTVNTQRIKFKGFPAIKVSGGDRTVSFQGFLMTEVPSAQFKIKINPYENSGTVTMYRTGYRPMGPVFFKCFGKSASNQTANSAQGSIERSEFKRLSSCNRRYVQQFLKGQGFYSSSIDGKWGPGTAAAVKRAMKMPKFRNLTAAQFFDTLINNPVC